MQPLTVGTPAPDFTLNNQDGSPVQLTELLKTGPVVLYFYPKDFTPVCTKQSCGFRDRHDEFGGHGAQIVGISGDSSSSHASFASKFSLPFPLLADSDGKVHEAYGVKRGGLFGARITYVVDKDGTIQHVTSARFRANPHVQDALQAVESLL